LFRGEVKQGRPTFFEYLAGGLLGNVPLIILVFVLSFYDPRVLIISPLFVNIVILSSLVLGAALAAFYVAVGVQSSHIARVIAVGLVTGGFCYLINIAFSYFLIPGLPLGDYWKLATFIPGGALGAFIRTKRKKRTTRRPPPSSPDTSKDPKS